MPYRLASEVERLRGLLTSLGFDPDMTVEEGRAEGINVKRALIFMAAFREAHNGKGDSPLVLSDAVRGVRADDGGLSPGEHAAADARAAAPAPKRGPGRPRLYGLHPRVNGHTSG